MYHLVPAIQVHGHYYQGKHTSDLGVHHGKLDPLVSNPHLAMSTVLAAFGDPSNACGGLRSGRSWFAMAILAASYGSVMPWRLPDDVRCLGDVEPTEPRLTTYHHVMFVHA